MTQRVDEALRDAFAEWAGSVSAERDPYEATRRGIRQARRRRWFATAVSLCLVAAVAVPVAAFRPFRDVPLEGWGIRGNLADRQAFVEAARKEAVQEIELASGLGSGERVEYSRVVYAGEHGPFRKAAVVVTVARENTEETEQAREETQRIRWLLLLGGPARGSSSALEIKTRAILPGGMSEFPEELLSETPTLAWARKRAGGGAATLFVLGPPGTEQVAYSARPSFHPDGTWERSWQQVQAREGVAYRRLPNLDMAGSLVRLRVDGESIYSGVQRSLETFSDNIHPEPSDAASGVPPQVALDARSRLRRSTGLAPNDFRLRLLWHEGEERWLVAATRQDGVTFQVFSTNVIVEAVLVPRGQAGRPAATVSPHWQGNDSGRVTYRVAVVAPGVAQGHVELWRGDDKLTAARLGDDSYIELRGREVVDAVRADDARLTFRIFDRHGRQVYRGRVRDGWQSPWNQPASNG